MFKHSRTTIALLVVIVASPAVGDGQAAGLTPGNATKQPVQAWQDGSSPKWAQAIQIEAEANRQALKKLLEDAQSRGAQSPQVLDSSTQFEPKNGNGKEALLKQVDDAQQRLSMAYPVLARSPDGQELGKMFQLLLDIARGKLMGETPTAEMRERNSQLLVATQRRLDDTRRKVRESRSDLNVGEMLRQLDAAQRRLDKAKKEVDTVVP